MAYVLQPLLNIRAMREDRASGELTAAKRAVRTAEEALDDRKRELADYESTKEERRDRIYDAIIGRTVNRDQIDMAQEGVARIDEEGAIRLDNVHQAEGELKKKQSEAEAARAVFITASKNRMKIDEHKSVWRENEAKEAEARTEIAAEKEAALRDVRKEVAVLSVSIAEKILRKELSEDKEQREYIDRMVEETVREQAQS